MWTLATSCVTDASAPTRRCGVTQRARIVNARLVVSGPTGIGRMVNTGAWIVNAELFFGCREIESGREGLTGENRTDILTTISVARGEAGR